MARPPFVRRYLPIIVIAAVTVTAIGVSVLARDNADDASRADPAPTSDGPVMLDDANVDDIAWGPNCDTDTGRVKLPTIYAPPCVEPWEPGQPNGGSTSPGVTADEITVAVYQPQGDDLGASLLAGAGVTDTAEQARLTRRRLFELFEQVTQTYGRRIKVVGVAASGGSDNHAAARADAIRVATEIRPFIAIGGPFQSSAYGEELASRGVVCLGGCAGPVTEEFIQDHAPYVWGQLGASPQGEWLVKRVAGAKAEFAGDPTLANRRRRFGLISYDSPDGTFRKSVEEAKRRLAADGVDIVADATYYLDLNTMQESARTMVAKMRDADVTTVIFAGDPFAPIYLTAEATAQNWFPEWIPSGYVLDDTNVFARQYDPKQWAHAFGAVFGPARLPQDQADGYALYLWGYDEPPPAPQAAVLIGPTVLQVMIGIHLAGPDLTPETFRDGLFRYPPTGGGPTAPQISWGYHDSDVADYAPFDDGTEIWYDAEAVGVDEIGAEGTGMYRFSDGGKRYAAGDWPDRPTDAFRIEGSVTGYAERPAKDQAPQYSPPN